MSRLTPLCAGRLSSHLGAGAAARTAAAAHSHLLALRAVGDGPRRAPGLAADRALGAAREVRDDARAAEGVRAVQLDRIVRDVHADRAAPVAVRVVRLHRLERHRRRSSDRRRLLAGRAGRGAGAAAALSAHESRTPSQALGRPEAKRSVASTTRKPSVAPSRQLVRAACEGTFVRRGARRRSAPPCTLFLVLCVTRDV